MSLVSEALRKARQEAAAREAARRGRVVPSGLVEPPRRAHAVPRLLLLGALTIVAGLAGALGAWLVLGRTPEPAAAGHRSGAPGSVPAPSPAIREVRAGSAAPADPNAPSFAAARREPSPSQAAQNLATPPAAAPSPLAGHLVEILTTPPVGAAQAAPLTAPTGIDRTFVLDADLGRVRLHLDFVVYKPSAPFAGINGTQVVPGSIVEGLVVEEIGRDFVRLRDGRSTVTLRVR